MVPAQVIRASACAPDQVRAMLAAGWTVKTDTSGGREDLDRLLSLGGTYRLQDESGQVLGAYILQENGPELWIVLGAGRADIDLTAVGLALIEAQGRQFDSIGFVTRRRGLVRKALKLGFAVVAKNAAVYTLRKTLK
jgi:hypothetical protein